MKAKEQIKILDNFVQEIWNNVQGLRKEVNELDAVDGAHRLKLAKLDEGVASMQQYFNEALKNISKTCDELKRQCSIFDTARQQRIEELRIHGNRIYDLENSDKEIREAFEALTVKTYNDVKKVKDTVEALERIAYKVVRIDIADLKKRMTALEEPNTIDVRLAKLENSFDTNSKKLKDDTASAVSDINKRLNCLESSQKCHRNDIDRLRERVYLLEEENTELKKANVCLDNRAHKAIHALNEIDKALKESGEFDTWQERRKAAQK